MYVYIYIYIHTTQQQPKVVRQEGVQLEGVHWEGLQWREGAMGRDAVGAKELSATGNLSNREAQQQEVHRMGLQRGH